MQITILVILLVEALLLICLALFGKLSRKLFLLSAVPALICCAVNIWAVRSNAGDEKETEQREYIYMAARLTEQDHADKALQAMSQVTDAALGDCDPMLLRGLDYLMEKDYRTAELYLNGQGGEKAEKLLEFAKQEQQVEEEIKKMIIEDTIKALNLSSALSTELDQRLKVLYLYDLLTDTEKEENAGIENAYAKIRCAVEENEYETAYALAEANADTGNYRDRILLAEMYIANYDRHIQNNTDAGYQDLNLNAVRSLTELNRAAVKLAEMDQNNNQQEKREYDLAWAKYSIASQDISQEALLRVLKYLEANQPEDAEENIAWQFYMAELHYRLGDSESCRSCLDKIFRKDTINTEYWLGPETDLLVKLYLDVLSGGDVAAFEKLFNEMLDAYGQGILKRSDGLFLEFCKEYLRGLYEGITIHSVDVSSFPDITVELSTTTDELKLTPDCLIVTDTDEVIAEYELKEEEVPALQVSFVLDISGSMEGDNMIQSKKAIKESVLKLDENARAGLVFFDDQASVACEMTSSKYAVSSAVDRAKADGGTNIAAGLDKAADMLIPGEGKKVVILLSDGYDGESRIRQDVMDKLRKYQIQVYTIGLEGCDQNYLSDIANRTGGSFIMADRTDQLTQIYQNIQGYITRAYFLRYTVSTDDENRYLHLRMRDSLIQSRREYLKTQPVYEEEVISPDADITDHTQEKQSSDLFHEIGGDATGGDR